MLANKSLFNNILWEEIYAGNLEELPWLSNPIPHEIFGIFNDSINGNKKLLDYGCGNGRLARIFIENNAIVTCADISQNALELCKKQVAPANLIETKMPNIFPTNSFNAILCWGVLHHIAPQFRDSFMSDFKRIVAKNSFMLIGGWSDKDCEFQTDNRISSVTNSETWAIDADMDRLINQLNLKIYTKDYFHFIESVTKKERIFVYYLLRT